MYGSHPSGTTSGFGGGTHGLASPASGDVPPVPPLAPPAPSVSASAPPSSGFACVRASSALHAPAQPATEASARAPTKRHLIETPARGDKHTGVFVSYNLDDAKEKILIARQVHEERGASREAQRGAQRSQVTSSRTPAHRPRTTDPSSTRRPLAPELGVSRLWPEVRAELLVAAFLGSGGQSAAALYTGVSIAPSGDFAADDDCWGEGRTHMSTEQNKSVVRRWMTEILLRPLGAWNISNP